MAYSLLSSFRKSMEHEKIAKDIFVEGLGANHERVAESKFWLTQFTTNAVQLQSGKKVLAQPSSFSTSSALTWITSGTLPRIPVRRASVNDVLKLMNHRREAAAEKQSVTGTPAQEEVTESKTSEKEQPSLDAPVAEKKPSNNETNTNTNNNAAPLSRAEKKRLRRKMKKKKSKQIRGVQRKVSGHL